MYERLFCAAALSSALIAAAATPTAAAPAGARAGDQEITCAAVLAERTSIEADIGRRSEAKAAGDRRKEGLMRFAKGAMTYAAPSVLGQLGGNSYAGSIAAQAASQGAAQAFGQPYGSGAPTPTVAPASVATPDETARLDRLAKIAAYRQCAA